MPSAPRALLKLQPTAPSVPSCTPPARPEASAGICMRITKDAPPTMIIVGGASFVILMQIPALASGLAGGVQLGTLGAVGWSFNKARGALGMARPQNARAAYRSVRRDAMALRA